MLRTRATFIYTRPIRRRSDPNNSRNEDSSRTFGNFGWEELAAIHLFLFLFATTNVSQDYLIGGPIGGARLRLTWRLTKSLAIICITRSPLAIVQPRIPTSRLHTTVHGLNSLFLLPPITVVAASPFFTAFALVNTNFESSKGRRTEEAEEGRARGKWDISAGGCG